MGDQEEDHSVKDFFICWTFLEDDPYNSWSNMIIKKSKSTNIYDN
jgi:hypothetical protein